MRILKCEVCGGVRIRVAVWYRSDQRTVVGEVGKWDQVWSKFCEDCKANTPIVEVIREREWYGKEDTCRR